MYKGERVVRHVCACQSLLINVPRDTIRFDYKHSVLREGTIDDRNISGGQRLSLMIRVSILSLEVKRDRDGF